MRLEIRNLTKRFGSHAVLDNVNLSLDDIHSLVLIGPSGGGKTTLLRILAGLETMDEGEITINRHKLNCADRELIQYRRHIGMVFQSYNLFPHLTALENILLPLTRVHKMNRQTAGEHALALLERFHLADHARKHPAALSGGQQQRIAICRAVAIRPEYLLLDEPTSALDPEYTSEVLDLIQELRKEGMELILVTHEMGFAHRAADYMLFIADGGIGAHGSPHEFFETQKYPRVSLFLDKVLKYTM
jgi:polar amino acid transport system ATP-binding protein